MSTRIKFDPGELMGKPGEVRDKLKKLKINPRIIFIITGIVATIWFLVRVIPKPSRAAYPCMKIAAPFMSGLVLYLLSVWGITIAARKTGHRILNSRYFATFLLVMGVVVVLAVTPSQNTTVIQQKGPVKTGPDDGPNKPMGKETGIYPGRVVWIWDPKATNAECLNSFEFCRPENTNQGVVNRMVVDGIKKLSGKSNLSEAWDAIFRSFNKKKHNSDKGYTQGEKIFIKINQGTANAKLRPQDIDNGFYIPARMTESEQAKNGIAGTCETYPNVTLEILRELVNVMGIEQKNIAIGDPISHIFGHNYEVWATEFPDVIYVDRASEKHGRTLIRPTKTDLVFYSDKSQSDKLYDIIESADYLINVANLKPHGRAGISLTAKNHFGSHARPSAAHLHYSLISPVSLGNTSNSGYGKYRVMVDIMGSRYLGGNTLLFVVDGLYGGGSNETRVPVKYLMPPFDNDWSNSVFMAQDQVALESVCYDFLRSEWNGTYQHNQANNAYEDIPNVNGVDDYLHQAADPSNWPEKIKYDPDKSGKPLVSLGIHEHWNDPVNKQYSRNLGLSSGIELISIPDNLVKTVKTASESGSMGQKTGSTDTRVEAGKTVTAGKKTSSEVQKQENQVSTGKGVSDKPFEEGFKARNFYSVVIDDDNVKWFLTDAGIVSFNGTKWQLHNKNRKVPPTGLKDFAFDVSDYGRELWLATSQGATVATIPVDARSGATTYYKENSTILSDTVVAVAVGKGALRWFGTTKGVSAFLNKKWLKYSYQRQYPESLFKDFPITAMATTPGGDSLYVATEGAGVARLFKDDVDAISGASEYAIWGPIEMPSDKVYSICITPDGTQWFGTDLGIARHIGSNTLENWSIFNTDNGLVDNFVQAIAADKNGALWFGTKGGISVLNGEEWKSFTENDGLISNNIQCIATDKTGTVWFGTDKGVITFNNGNIINYR